MNNQKGRERLEKTVAMIEKKIKNIVDEDSLIFPIFSDLHISDSSAEGGVRLIEALELLCGNVKTDGVIAMGDNLSIIGRDNHVSNDKVKEILKDLLGKIYDAVNVPIIAVNGNHDAIGTDFFKADFWNDITKGSFGNTAAVYADTGSYYYIDYDKANLRMVVMSIPFDSDLQAEYPTPLWKFGAKQLKWFKETALNTEKDVVLLSHVPFYYDYKDDRTQILDTWDGEKLVKSYIMDLMGRVDDRDDAVKIINEFNVNSKGKVLACFSGHTHMDSFWKPFEVKDEETKWGKNKGTNPLPCHQIVTDMTCRLEDEEVGIEVQIDVVVYTPKNKEFNLFRIGIGDDREFKAK